MLFGRKKMSKEKWRNQHVLAVADEREAIDRLLFDGDVEPSYPPPPSGSFTPSSTTPCPY